MDNKNLTNNITNMSIDDGLEKIVVNNKHGNEIGTFYFRPTDTDIVNRYNESLARLEEAIEPLKSEFLVPSDADADTAAEAIMNAISEAKTKLCDAFDYIFDANVSEAFFGRVNPFTLIGGRFYCENVIEAIGSFIAERLGVEVRQLSDRAQKYTHGYAARTGKHKDGKR